jgi:hypothetical protein
MGDVYGINPIGLANKWTYVTAVFYNGVYTGKNQLYINGVQQTISQCVGSAQSGTASSNFHISGSPIEISGYYFNGTIADFRLYRGALSSQQALSLYLSQTPPSAATSIGMSLIK